MEGPGVNGFGDMKQEETDESHCKARTIIDMGILRAAIIFLPFHIVGRGGDIWVTFVCTVRERERYCPSSYSGSHLMIPVV